MQEIAQLSGGRSFNAQSADELSSIYKQLGHQLGSVTRKRDVTAAFAIGGLVFLLLGAAGSTRWSGPPPLTSIRWSGRLPRPRPSRGCEHPRWT